MIFSIRERTHIYVLTYGAYLLILFCCLGAVSDNHFTQKDFAQLDVLLGKWKTKKNNADIYEVWKKRDQNSLAGLSIKVMGKDTTYLESVRLFYGQGWITYAPVAYGQNNDEEVPFGLIDMKKNRFVFENTKHDFPQRIIYQAIGVDSIHAYIEGAIKGTPRRSDFYFSRIK